MTIETMRNRLLILLFFAALFSPKASQAQALILKADSVTVPCHDVDTFLMPIRADNFTNLAGLQFSFAWNPANLDYAYITEIHPTLTGVGFDTTTFISQGKLGFAWTTISGGLSLPNNTVLFKVAFARLGGPASPVTFTNAPPTDIFAIDPMFNAILVDTIPGLVTPVDNEPPTVDCPANVTQEVFGPSPVNNIGPTPLDNCSIESIGWSSAGATPVNFHLSPNASGSTFNLGLSTVTYEVEDSGGNTATCSFSINLTLAPSDSLTLIASSGSGSCGQQVVINISVLNYDSIGGLQFSLNWDPAVLEFDTIANANPSLFLDLTNFSVVPAGGDSIGFAWTSAFQQGLTLSNGSVLFSLVFNVIATGNNASTISFSNNPTQMVAFSNANFPPSVQIGFLTVNGLATTLDSQPPSIQCPPNQFVQTPIGVLNATFNNLAPLSLTDNCTPNVGLTYQQMGVMNGSGSGPANGTYNAGTTVVTYTGTDGSGNTATCSFTVTVDAGTPLTIILDTVLIDCQATNAQIAVDLTVRDFINIAGLQFDVTWDSSIIKFDSVGNMDPTLGLTPGMFFGFVPAMGGNTLKFFGTNISGWPTVPDDSTIFTIYFTVQNPNGFSNINFTGVITAASVQGGIPVFIPVVPIHGFFQSSDLTPPIITCTDFIVPADNGVCTATFLLNPPTASDACSGIQSVVTNPPYDTIFTYPSGATVVTFMATDSVGNSATCQTTVTVLGSVTPQLTGCPADVTVGITTAACATAVTWNPPTAFNPCDGSALNVLASDTSGTAFPLGDSTVVFTTFNTSGDTTTCSFTVTVLDSLAPVFINCQDPAPVQADSTCSAIVVIDPLIVGDNCTQNIVPVPDIDVSLPFQVGSSQVIFTATDASGNSASCTMTITVFDGQSPVFDNCPSDVTVYSAADSCGASVFWNALTATDDCTAILSIDPPNYSGEFFTVGTNQVQYSVSDGFTQAGTCAFSVTVLDTIAPVFSVCPFPITIFLPADKCDTLLNWITPLVEDGCSIDSIFGSHANPTNFPTGVHPVEYIAFDPSGNNDTCSFTVTVLDVVDPVLDPCPLDTVIMDASPCGVLVHWDLPDASDNCLLASVYSIPASDSLITATVTTVVVYAEDASGNQDTCSFTVTLQVVFEPPAFVNFPADTIVYGYGCPQPVSWTLPVSNGKNCNPDTVVFFPDLIPNDTFQLGDTTITYYLIDLVTGDTLVQQPFTISVQDTVPPQFVGCPTAPVVAHVGGVLIENPGLFMTSIDTVSGCAGVELTFNLPGVTDSCSIPAVDQTAGPLTGGIFEADSLHAIVFTATDASGNTSSCVVSVAVVGLQPINVTIDPPVACPPELVMLIAEQIPGAVYMWTGPAPGIDQENTSIVEIFASTGNTGTYSVSASLNGCTTPPAPVDLLVYAVQAVADTIIISMDSTMATFSVVANDSIFPAGDFVLDTTCSILPPGVSYIGNGVFSFEVNDQFRPFEFFYCLCSASCPDVCDTAALVSVQLDVMDCSFIPNVITPNKDGVNDYFRIPCLDSNRFGDNSIVIYNQWGDKVFDAAPYDNMWDGTLNGEGGKDLPDGVYYYIFQSGSSQPMRKGFIQIQR